MSPLRSHMFWAVMLTCVSEAEICQEKPSNTAWKVIMRTSVMRKDIEGWRRGQGILIRSGLARCHKECMRHCYMEAQNDFNGSGLRGDGPYGRVPATVR